MNFLNTITQKTPKMAIDNLGHNAMILTHDFLDYRQPWALPDIYLFIQDIRLKNDVLLRDSSNLAHIVHRLYPNMTRDLGAEVVKQKRNTHLAFALVGPCQVVGVFKNKTHLRETERTKTFADSAIALGHIARAFPKITFHLAGLNLTGTRYKECLLILSTLPDNVCYHTHTY